MPTGTSVLGQNKSVLGKLEAVLLRHVFRPKSSPLRLAVLGGKNLIY